MHRAAVFIVGALLLTAGCTTRKAAAVEQGDSMSASAEAVATAHAAVAALARQDPNVFRRFSRQPGKTTCPQNIGDPAPGVVLMVTCDMRVAQSGSTRVITLLESRIAGAPDERTRGPPGSPAAPRYSAGTRRDGRPKPTTGSRRRLPPL